MENICRDLQMTITPPPDPKRYNIITVDELPETGENDTIYIVGDDVYIWTEAGWSGGCQMEEVTSLPETGETGTYYLMDGVIYIYDNGWSPQTAATKKY